MSWPCHSPAEILSKAFAHETIYYRIQSAKKVRKFLFYQLTLKYIVTAWKNTICKDFSTKKE